MPDTSGSSEPAVAALPLDTDVTSEDRAFARREAEVVNHLFRLAPSQAVALGLHAYDGRLPDLSKSFTAAWVRQTKHLQGELDALSPHALSRPRQLDRELLRLRLESELFDLVDFPVFERMPLVYLGPLSLVPYLARPYAPATQRVEAIVRTLRGAPGLLRTGREVLRRPLARAFVQVALAMAEGLSPHYRETEAFVRESAPGELSTFLQACGEAEAAVEAFVTHLKNALPTGTEDFALGPRLYQRMLYVREGVRTPWEEILKEGWKDLRANQARLDEIARTARPPSTPERLLESMARDHPSAERLLPETATYLEELRAFVLAKDLVTLPTPEHCRVEPTPPVERAWSTASMDPPGPFEGTMYEGVYHVTPVDPAWDEGKQEQWLRSFNRPVLRNVTAHEVYPGHYVQFLHFRAHAASLTGRVYVSTAFTEGWAHYTEQLMIEQGYGAGSPFAEMAQLTDALLRDVRLLASIGMHAQGMSVAQATDLFVREARMERFPASREAMRGTFNPEYVGYTLGKLAILRARRTFREREPRSTLRAFHDRLLAFGAPPVGFLEPLLTGDELSPG